MRKLLIVILLLLPFQVFAGQEKNPPEIAKYFGNAQALGKGSFNWFLFKLYDGKLWSENKPWKMSGKFALRLEYSRDISSADLVMTSLDEIKRLRNADDKKLKRYGKMLAKVFPEVKKGDTIAAINLPGENKVAFYHNGKLKGELDGGDFAVDFFSIWLDPNTQASVMREQLIGGNTSR